MKFSELNNLKPQQGLSFIACGFRRAELISGQLEISNKDISAAQQVYDMWNDFRVYLPGVVEYKVLPLVCKKLLKNSEYDHKRMLKQIEKNPVRFVKCGTNDEYMKNMQEIYNYNMQKKNRLTLVEI